MILQEQAVMKNLIVQFWVWCNNFRRLLKQESSVLQISFRLRRYLAIIKIVKKKFHMKRLLIAAFALSLLASCGGMVRLQPKERKKIRLQQNLQKTTLARILTTRRDWQLKQ